ncbi:hypothetical protein ACRRTK_022721 [Alexandromys fortis]
MVSYAKCTLDFIGNAEVRDGGTWLTTSAHRSLRQEDPGQSELTSMIVSQKQNKMKKCLGIFHSGGFSLTDI